MNDRKSVLKTFCNPKRFFILTFIMSFVFILNGCYEEYTSYDELTSLFVELESDYPEIAKKYNLGTTSTGAVIWALKISDNVEKKENEPVIYIDGGTHGNEWVSVEVPKMTAFKLVTEYDTDNKITYMVDNAEIWIVPMVNPDGHMRIYDKLNSGSGSNLEVGRKNQGPGERTGVDLNRNFPSYTDLGTGEHFYNEDWCDPCYADTSSISMSLFYCGSQNSPEPETMAIMELLINNPPAAVLSYHSYGQYIIQTDRGLSQELIETSETFAEEMQTRLNEATDIAIDGEETYGRQYVYRPGTEIEWTSRTFNAPSFIVELRPKEWVPGYKLPPEQIEATFNENWAASSYLIETLIDTWAENSLNPIVSTTSLMK